MDTATSLPPTENLLIEEREEILVSEKGRCLRKTHFLKPFVTSLSGGSVAELPRRDFQRPSDFSLELKHLSSRVYFSGFWSAECLFLSWLRKMEALHAPTWRKAGIFEAIKASTYKITKSPSLILSIAEKWCPETKTFVFPWGEATITLEDVMVLLGFSVLGSPIFAPVETSEMRDSVKFLQKVRLENKSKDGTVSQVEWILSFRNRDDSLEHEAFLALWLSHFVFPNKSQRSISKKNLSIAVRLARGERIALATPVLASLYKDLGEISRGTSTKNLNLKSLFKLVQVWTWERFKNLSPVAKEIPKGEPRVSRWGSLKQKTGNVRLSFDDFEWRPYTKHLKNCNPLRFYADEAMWVTVDDKLKDECVSFARCVRSSTLVGIGFVEDYYPNRVAMQFGLAQDLPGLVNLHSKFTKKEAWDDYNKPLDGSKLYMPSRLATTFVTTRYQVWWLKSVSEFLVSSESTETVSLSNTVEDDDNVPPKVLPLSQVLQKLGGGFPQKLRKCRTRKTAKSLRCSFSTIQKDKIGDGDGSASTEVLLSRLFQMELIKKTSGRLRNKRREQAHEDDEDCNDTITTAQRIKSGEKIEGNASESPGKRSKLEDDNNDTRICQKHRIEENGEEEAGSEAWNNMVLSPFDENEFFDPPLGANDGVVDTVVSPPETIQTCDDELNVYGSSAEQKPMIDVEFKEPDCLLHEDGIIAGEKPNSEERLCSSEDEKEDDVVDDDSLIQKKLAVDEVAVNNVPSPRQKLASGDANGDETSKLYKSKVLSTSDESNIHIGDGSQGYECLLHDNALGSEETMKSNEQLEDLEKRNNDFGKGDADNDSYEQKFQELRVLASSIEELIIKVERNVAQLNERKATIKRKIAEARWF